MELAAKLPKYKTYKDSGVAWLGDIPDSWKLIRLKYLVEILKRIAGKEGPDVLSITQQGIKIKDIESGEGQLAMDYSKYQLLYQGEFAMNHMDLLTGYVDLSAYDGVVSPDYRVFKKTSPKITNAYLLLLFQIGYNQKVFYKYGQGVSLLGRWRLPADNFNNFLVPVPSTVEQTAIANFLDKKTTQIDEAITIKQQQIELLKERKQIIIQQVVTRGLDPDVPMKDSEVEWIKKTPKHWEIKKVKHLFKLVMEPSEKNNNHELLSVYTDIGVKPRRELEERGNKASTTDGYWFVKKGDIVVNKLLAWMGAIGVSDYDGVTSPAYDILRPKTILNGYFYHFLFRCNLCSSELKRHSRGIMEMRLRLYFDKFGIVEVPYPPVEEQNEIINFIKKQCEKVDGAIEVQQQQIERLQEYKTTLINSTVTGKIKVPTSAKA